jgi:hypothetical protein
VTSLWAGRRRNLCSIPVRGKKCFYIPPRPAVGPNWPPIQWALGALFPGRKAARGMKLTTEHHLVPKLRMYGLYIHNLYMRSWRTLLLFVIYLFIFIFIFCTIFRYFIYLPIYFFFTHFLTLFLFLSLFPLSILSVLFFVPFLYLALSPFLFCFLWFSSV